MSRVPPQPSGGSDPPPPDELAALEELGDDAIIAQQQGAHAPKPRIEMAAEARSIVISDRPKKQLATGRKRSERTEKTVVIRDRRQLAELRRAIEKHSSRPAPAGPTGALVWVAVGVGAFVLGGLVAFFASRGGAEISAAPAGVPSQAEGARVLAPPLSSVEPPLVRIDELPVEGEKPK